MPTKKVEETVKWICTVCGYTSEYKEKVESCEKEIPEKKCLERSLDRDYYGDLGTFNDWKIGEIFFITPDDSKTIEQCNLAKITGSYIKGHSIYPIFTMLDSQKEFKPFVKFNMGGESFSVNTSDNTYFRVEKLLKSKLKLWGKQLEGEIVGK